MPKYKVVIEEVITREYEVIARTPEEAEDVAHEWKMDGEPGTVTNTDVLGIDAFEEEDDENDPAT